MRTTLLVLLATAGAAWLHFNVPPATACSCVALTPAQAFERADTVFVGKVVSFKVRSGLLGQSSVDPASAQFAVEEVWKGPRQETLTIRTVRSEGSCGFNFRDGLTYLVYARDGQTGLCDRTALAIHAVEDLAALGDGWKPEPSDETVWAPTPEVSESDAPGPGGRGGCNASSTAGRNRTDLAVLASIAGLVALSAWRKRGL